MTLSEPDVALTDFGLAAECALFAAWLWWRARAGGPLRRWFIVLFVALGAGALLGGVTHGFLGDPQPASAASRMVWTATLIAIATAALACWAIGAHMLLAQRAAGRVMTVAAVLFALNVAAVLWVSQSFSVAIVFYAPAVAFVLAAFAVAWFRTRSALLLPGIAGVVLSLAAAVIQQTGTTIAALGLSHNALYHVVQATGLALIFLTARRLDGLMFHVKQINQRPDVSRETFEET